MSFLRRHSVVIAVTGAATGAVLFWHREEMSRVDHAADAQKAMRGATTDASATFSTGSVEAMVGALSAHEVEAMLRHPRSFLAEGVPQHWRRALLTRWVQLEPVAAAEFAQQSAASDLAVVLESWSAGDHATASAWLRKFVDAPLAEGLLAGHAGSLPPVMVLIAFDKLPAGSDPAPALNALARASATAVQTWLRDSLFSSARQEMLVRYSLRQPDRARTILLDAMRDICGGPERTQLLNVIIGQWARTDPVAATEWVERMPDAQPAAGIWASLTANWAEKHPVQAAQIAAQLPPGPAQHEAVISVVSAWARQDPAAAAGWVGQFAEGQLRRDATQQLVFAWAMGDRLATEIWVSRLPPGPSRDAAVATLRQLHARMTGSTDRNSMAP